MRPPTARHPVARLCACVVLAVATLATGCSSQSAPPASTATIPQQFDDNQPAASDPTPPPQPDSAAATAPATDSDEESGGPELEQPDTRPTTEPPPPTGTTAVAEPTSSAPPISDRGVALGCIDATELRRWLGTSSESVAAIAAVMTDQVWLCPQSPDVIAQLDCFPDETSAILAELAIEIGSDIDDIVSQISSSNTAFCTSGDVVRLGLDDILDQIDDP